MNNQLIMEMTRYYSGDPKHIQHFMKVYAYARMIGEMEGLDRKTQHMLETAAIVHDIGIKESMKKYGDSAGHHQEQEGPAVAENMLERLGYEGDIIKRVCYLVGHHHTYQGIDGLDYQILVEADFLVNLYENGSSIDAVLAAMDGVFVTESGKDILRDMFLA